MSLPHTHIVNSGFAAVVEIGTFLDALSVGKLVGGDARGSGGHGVGGGVRCVAEPASLQASYKMVRRQKYSSSRAG